MGGPLSRSSSPWPKSAANPMSAPLARPPWAGRLHGRLHVRPPVLAGRVCNPREPLPHQVALAESREFIISFHKTFRWPPREPLPHQVALAESCEFITSFHNILRWLPREPLPHQVALA
eukprot:scaffold3347_cov382-Prasinococcus_capsulatus_cf.AAC.8